MRALIATPTTHGTNMAAYTQSVVDATIALHERGASYRYLSLDGADVVTSRNILTHSFLADASCDHILFIDSDMAITPSVFRHLFRLEVPIVGAAYTERKIDLGAYHAAMSEVDDPARARALASGFTIRMQTGKTQIKDMIVEAQGFGFGCVLIHRRVFEALIARDLVVPFKSSALQPLGIKDTVWDFFAPIQGEDGRWLSEDYAFCSRVRALGDVPLRAYVGPGVGHVGQYTFGAPYIERLKAGKV